MVWGAGWGWGEQGILQGFSRAHEINIPSILAAGGVWGGRELEGWKQSELLQWEQSNAAEEVLWEASRYLFPPPSLSPRASQVVPVPISP